MARLSIVAGVLLIIAGFVGPALSSFGMFGSAFGGNIPGLRQPVSTELCRPGESLEKGTGASTRVSGTNTFAQSVVYTCVDAKGGRRDVTGEFLLGLGSQATGFVQRIMGTALMTTGASIVGTFLLVVGILLSVRKGIASGKVRVVTPVYADVTHQFRNAASSAAGTASGNEKERLEKLESMYRSNLITQSEYDAKRKEILSEL